MNGFEPAQNIFDFLKPHDLAGIQELSRHVESSNSISFRKMASLITSRLQLSRQWTNSDCKQTLGRIKDRCGLLALPLTETLSVQFEITLLDVYA